MRSALMFLLVAVILSAASAVRAAPALVVSIDGLRPGDVLEADARGLKVPVLKAMVAKGAWASGVRNALPTVTYPNHTTLVTGVWPDRHGVDANGVFDPLRQGSDPWYLYADEIKVPTLWQAVHAAGGKSASVGWPATAGSGVIDFNIPEHWRTRQTADTALQRLVSTPGLPEAVQRQSGQSAEQVLDMLAAEPANDEAKARTAATIYALKKPTLFTLHLASLDHAQHTYGPGSPEAHAALERIDAALGALVAAARKAEPDLVVFVVSDHGFAPVEHDVHLTVRFIQKGLVRLDSAGRIQSWDAMPWVSGASAAVVLARRDDEALRKQVADLLAELQSFPESGVGRVLDRAGIAAMGGNADADFFVDAKIGYEFDGRLTAPLVTAPSANKGTHGYFPDHPEMRATLIVDGPGLARRGPLGEVDMRDIAPTVAKVLKVRLPTAAGRPLF